MTDVAMAQLRTEVAAFEDAQDKADGRALRLLRDAMGDGYYALQLHLWDNTRGRLGARSIELRTGGGSVEYGRTIADVADAMRLRIRRPV